MTDRFLNNIRSITKDTIPIETYIQAKRCLIDYIAVILPGAQLLSSKTLDYIQSVRGESQCSTVIGLNCKTDMQTAALINGINSHVIELDDGHRQGALHVGSTIFSALIAVAEKENLASKDFLYGVIIGYEVAVRLACAVQPGNKLRGYHATGTCGTVGAAMGVAAALGFNQEQMKSTLSAAVTSASGLLEMQEDNSDYKPLNVGRAAMDAIAAAYLGKVGFTPPFDPIGGNRGFLKVMTNEPKINYLTDFEEEFPLAITQIYMKTYASCRHTHPAIEAALKLKKEHNLSPQQIASIEVESYRLAVFGHDHTEILGISSAKMSLPFCVALALCTGSAGMGSFNEENVKNETILGLSKKVIVKENEELSSWVPKKRASILHVIMIDGRVLTYQVDYPKGEPENPLSDNEVEEKFISLAMSSGFTMARCQDILQAIKQPTFRLKTLLDKLN